MTMGVCNKCYYKMFVMTLTVTKINRTVTVHIIEIKGPGAISFGLPFTIAMHAAILIPLLYYYYYYLIHNKMVDRIIINF